MADNYTQGTVSPLVPLDLLARAVLDLDTDYYDEEDATDLDIQARQVLEELLGSDLGDTRLQLTVYTEVDDLCYLCAEDGAGDAELAFLQWLIQRLPEEYKYLTFEYANTCSKMRRGEFGGGAWFVTRTGVHCMDTGSWLQARIAEVEG